MVGKRLFAKLGKGKTLTPEASSHTALTVRDRTIARIEQYGLFRLNPTDPDLGDVEYALDIVAVHGITGDAYRTWTAENGKLWLRDFLPTQFPGARIYSYGYPAEVFYSKSTADLDDYARKLLECLKAERADSKVSFMFGVDRSTILIMNPFTWRAWHILRAGLLFK